MSTTTYTEMSVRETTRRGAGDSIEHLTRVVTRQDYDDHPANGKYAGKSYRITQLYIGTRAGARHTCLRTSSDLWPAVRSDLCENPWHATSRLRLTEPCHECA